MFQQGNSYDWVRGRTTEFEGYVNRLPLLSLHPFRPWKLCRRKNRSEESLQLTLLSQEKGPGGTLPHPPLGHRSISLFAKTVSVDTGNCV